MSTLPQREPLNGKIAFRVPAKLQQRVRIEAIRRGTSVQELCREAVERHLEAIKSKKPEAA